MASIRQIEANRANAKRSTGPRTMPGKVRSSRNALRHGLATSCKPDAPTFAAAIRAGLGCEIGPEAAAAVADAKCELWRVRLVRHALLAALGGDPVGDVARRLEALERYERSALAAQKRALRSLKAPRV
ncbi:MULTISPECIES: hypothetical protein [unclassified Bradyrhizobium]|uniref:hypothetical protein n=1 Tax=unclassified Bradyrhizobium TaxID=2631580 RepID=UPI001FFBC66E|nr:MULTISPECIES: hypothetical protein [unclassified Bradyrhizobium]MCK1324667.1 hypothetical protein [Bradyrhizobium sp. 156]MCK1351427.1 hypothetical protein [Bradyrhizobium sp. CW7]UPJ94220.1 hypothetical protein IVB07_27475 [Bradyrhizobium sp. 172]